MTIPEDITALVDQLNPWWRDRGVRGATAWPVRRSPHRRLLDHLLQPGERRAQVLLGPRQVGKTTLLKQLADDLLDHGWPPKSLTYFDCEDYRLKRQVVPEEIAGLRPPGDDEARPHVYLLDELHHVPRWDRWLKHAVDQQLGRIVVTGSVASLLREGGRESGLGRWDEILLEGLTYPEFVGLARESLGSRGASDSAREGGRATLDPELVERYLALGGFPAYVTSDDFPIVRERLRSDIQDRAIRKDLEGQVEDPTAVGRLFVYLVQQSGGEQNASDRANDLGVDRRTVARWIELLQDTFLVSTLPRGGTSAKAAARLRGRPRVFACDHGVVGAFAEAPIGDAEVRSRIFEAVVYRHLREIARTEKGRVYYLRWGDGLEVDFVLELGREQVAIEVTHSVQPKPSKRKRLEQAAERVGASRAVLVHGGLAEGDVDGVVFAPLSRFLVDPSAAILERRS